MTYSYLRSSRLSRIFALVWVVLLLTAGSLTAVSLAAPAPAWAGDFVFTGLGYGHGVGMSQWGAWARDQDGQSFRDILGFYYDGADVVPLNSPNPEIKVKLSSEPWRSVYSITQKFRQVDLKAVTGPVTLATYSSSGQKTVELPRDRDTEFSLRPQSDGVVVVTGGETQGPYQAVEVRPGAEGRLGVYFSTASENDLLREYWGTIRVEPSDTEGYLTAYNLVHLEKYVRSIAEVEYDWAKPTSDYYAPEAVKAQAVAARTYAVKRMQQRGFIHDNQWDQVYVGYWGNGGSWGDGEHTDPFEARYPGLPLAAEATTDLVLKYQGNLITSFFSSHNGGYTNSWATDGYPYLVAKPDPIGLQVPVRNPGYEWEYTASQEEVSAEVSGLDDIADGRDVEVGTVRRIEFVERDTGDPDSHATKLRLTGTAGTAVVSARDFRSRFGYSKLKSTLILTITNPDGTVSSGPDLGGGGDTLYSDVPLSHLYHQEIGRVSEEGLVAGYPDGGFRPEESVSRWQFAKMMVGLHNALFPEDQIEVKNVSARPFPDVPPDSSVSGDESDWVAAAFRAGLVRGDTLGAFHPYQPVRRDQMATMVVRALGWEAEAQQLASAAGTAGGPEPFLDVNPNSPHYAAATYLHSLGVLRGYEASDAEGFLLDPGASTMRMHVAVIVCRVLDL